MNKCIPGVQRPWDCTRLEEREDIVVEENWRAGWGYPKYILGLPEHC